MKNQQIALNEQELHMLIEDAVNNYLVNEGIWGGVQNAYRGVKYNNNWNFGRTFTAGKYASSFEKYAKQAINALRQLANITNQTNNEKLASIYNSWIKNLDYQASEYRNVANRELNGGNATVNQNFDFNNRGLNSWAPENYQERWQ